MGVIPIENRRILEVDSFLLKLEELLGDMAGLDFRCGHRKLERKGATVAVWSQSLLELTDIVDNRSVCEFEDGRNGSVVCLEPKHTAVRVALWKPEDVFKIRAAERIDGLGVVANDHHIAFGSEHRIDNVCLQPIRILVLVHQNMVEAGAKIGSGAGKAVQKEQPIEEEIVEIHEIGISFSFEVTLEDVCNQLAFLQKLGRTVGQDIGEFVSGVDDKTIDVGQASGVEAYV